MTILDQDYDDYLEFEEGLEYQPDPIGSPTDAELTRQTLILTEIRMLRAEHALRTAGLPVPCFRDDEDPVAAHDAGLLCPGCAAELSTPIGNGAAWSCVRCDRGWTPGRQAGWPPDDRH
ncbi:hypothetical protein ABGB07_24130 [Micromonosporaceae bacterium B7E4]